MHRKLNGGLLSVVLIIPLLIFIFATPIGTSLELDITGMHELELGHYQVWAEFDNKILDLGKIFGPDDVLSSPEDLNRANSITISIEPEGDHDSVPSGIIYLSGSIQDSLVELESPLTLQGAHGWTYEQVSTSENITLIQIEPFVHNADPTGEGEFGISVLDGEFVGLPGGLARII